MLLSLYSDDINININNSNNNNDGFGSCSSGVRDTLGEIENTNRVSDMYCKHIGGWGGSITVALISTRLILIISEN